ncbi:MAG TPA: hypothetical protein VL426_06315 [Candidatus Binatia bacterium]|jgi:hypothetical protein|nr:hypothetical protein [Candidatus Binatia bacterium]
MGFQVLMVLALLGAMAIPMLFGNCPAAMIASHLCILTVTLAIFFGTLNLNKTRGQK